MSKFQVGDRVVRTKGRWGNSRMYSEHVVRAVVSDGLQFEGDTEYTYSSDNYELIDDVLEEPTGA